MCPCLRQTDPFWTASSLSPSDHREVQNQSICSLVELLELAKGNATLLLSLRDPPREHPFHGSFLNITLEALLRSGFPQHQVRPGPAWEPRPGWSRTPAETHWVPSPDLRDHIWKMGVACPSPLWWGHRGDRRGTRKSFKTYKGQEQVQVLPNSYFREALPTFLLCNICRLEESHANL